MKAIISTVLAAAVAAALGACERHEWEETKALHQHHGGHGGDMHDGTSEHGWDDTFPEVLEDHAVPELPEPENPLNPDAAEAVTEAEAEADH